MRRLLRGEIRPRFDEMDDIYAQVFENNRQWVEERNAEDPDYFPHLAKGQSPDFLYIGCADSRVPANTLMGLEPGEVFVHRNVANLVHAIDYNINAVIQYAVTALKVKHIVVCGHYGCGGVQAAMQPADLGGLNKWLRGVRDVYRFHEAELEAITEPKARSQRLVELNVIEQCRNVIKTSWVQRMYKAHRFPVVHGWVYSLDEGLLKDLEVPFEKMLEDVQKVYRLEPAED